MIAMSLRDELQRHDILMRTGPKNLVKRQGHDEIYFSQPVFLYITRIKSASNCGLLWVVTLLLDFVHCYN